jgi:hypothetical protein
LTIFLLGVLSTALIIFNQVFVTLWARGPVFAGAPINLVFSIGLPILVLVTATGNQCQAFGNIKGIATIRSLQSLFGIVALYTGVRFFGGLGAAIAPVAVALAFGGWYQALWLSSRLRKNSI